MDEHIGLTEKVAKQILSKQNLCKLVQEEETTVGTVQRVHNSLLLYPTLLRHPPVQRNVFQCAEGGLRRLAAAGEHKKKKGGQAEADDNRMEMYSVALLQLLFSPALRSSFTDKQQQRLSEWEQQLQAQMDPPALARLTQQLQQLRTNFYTQDPFGHLEMAPFTVPGVKAWQLDARTSNKQKPSPAAPSASAPDVPFTHLPRTRCPRCDRLQPFYCTHCLEVIHPLAQGQLPAVSLPVAVDILLHPAVERKKSTALQALLLVQPRASVEEHTFPAVPAYDARTTAVVFPSKRALTVQQLTQRQTLGDEGADSAPSASSPPSSSPPSSCALTSLQRVIFLEGTWAEAEQMLSHPNLRALTHLRLDFAAAEEAEGPEQTSAETASSLSTPPTTVFWRYQKFGSGFLSSIEAIYYFLVQLQMCKDALLTSSAASPSPVLRYANLLWLFALSYHRYQEYYRRHPALLPLVSS